MASAIVYENVTEGANIETGRLFEGKKFWVAQRVPQRSALLGLIKTNGGSVVQLEKQADWMIDDHFRKNCLPGTINYEFIHKSIAKGEIQDPDEYPAGPRTGTAREVGSISRPAKATRASFTPEEDRILYKWARDAQRIGAAVNGNELYKQLESKYPQHPWQSWRDRYVKKLQRMPPSAFNIPDNAPPSPPSDHSSRVAEPPAVKKTGLVKNKDKTREATAEDQPVRKGTSASKDKAANEAPPTTTTKQAASRENYTVEQLAATFTTRDWEDLYAYVAEIDSCSKDDNSADEAWAGWAESKDNQTAEQWRQYYEKVVRPQWLRDSVSKREQIRRKVAERSRDSSSSPAKSQSPSQTQDEAVVASQAEEAALIEPPKHTASNNLPSDTGLASESTAQHETPMYMKSGYESALKRIRGETDIVPEASNTPRPAKIRRGISPPTLLEPVELVPIETQEQPLEVSSAVNSQPGSPGKEHQHGSSHSRAQEQVAQAFNDNEDIDSITSDDDVEVVTALPRPSFIAEDNDDDQESIASSIDITHIAPLPRPPQIPEDEDEDEEEEEDDLPTNSPTPRANRYAAFDTQAILSPSQAPSRLPALPRPDVPSSPLQHPGSDASTTQSLQIFSSYLQDTDREQSQPQPQQRPQALPRPASPTPSATSHASSEGSEDPDEPLSAAEMNDFFATQHDQGFSTSSITAALKRTRCRPGLATAVLDAWRRGDALPVQRGVWSKEDDGVVLSGDGWALEALERRHTLDGWGGITERIRFLEAWERR